jgi:vancomycin permeability regulator SanA
MTGVVSGKRLGWSILGVAIVYFLAVTSYIVYVGLHDQLLNADTIVVFGTKVEDDRTPSQRLQARLDEAVHLFKQGYAPRVVVSGGIDTLGHDEALVMKNYLLEQGVPSTAIDVDSAGITTRLTAKHVVQLPVKDVIVVSQYFHIARSVEAIRECGLTKIYHAHAPYFEFRDIYSIVREFFAWHWYRMEGCSS